MSVEIAIEGGSGLKISETEKWKPSGQCREISETVIDPRGLNLRGGV
jgi:hypothetical protein